MPTHQLEIVSNGVNFQELRLATEYLLLRKLWLGDGEKNERRYEILHE